MKPVTPFWKRNRHIDTKSALKWVLASAGVALRRTKEWLCTRQTGIHLGVDTGGFSGPSARGDPTGTLQCRCQNAERTARKLRTKGHWIGGCTLNRLWQWVNYSIPNSGKRRRGNGIRIGIRDSVGRIFLSLNSHSNDGSLPMLPIFRRSSPSSKEIPGVIAKPSLRAGQFRQSWHSSQAGFPDRTRNPDGGNFEGCRHVADRSKVKGRTINRWAPAEIYHSIESATYGGSGRLRLTDGHVRV